MLLALLGGRRRGWERMGWSTRPRKTFTGKVTSVRENFCFMESQPGQSNVYLSAYIADSSLINRGDVVMVKARWNATNRNWRAIGSAMRDGAVIPPRSSAASVQAPTTASRGTVSVARLFQEGSRLFYFHLCFFTDLFALLCKLAVGTAYSRTCWLSDLARRPPRR